VVDFLPKDSVLVHCIRAYLRFRILVGLRCMTESRLERLRQAISVYQKCCAVSLTNWFYCMKLIVLDQFLGRRAWIQQELWFFKATCRSPCNSRHSRKGDSRQFLLSPWWRISARICAGFQTDKYEKCGTSGMYNMNIYQKKSNLCPFGEDVHHRWETGGYRLDTHGHR